MTTQTLQKAEVKTKEALATELKLDTDVSTETASPELIKQADDIVEQLLSLDEKDLQGQDRQAGAIRRLGKDVQSRLAQQSDMLKAPMATLMKDTEDGGQVARDLLSLQEQVNAINPNRVDFTMSSVRRLLSKLPGVGTPLARWFAKYQSVDAVIKDVVQSLKDGRAQLERDNTTLRDDQRRMRELIFVLQDYIKLAQLLDQRLTAAINNLSVDQSERKRFLEEEVLFPLRQRIMDLQQQLAVNQQGVLATEVIIRNNRELMIGVDRALNVTITALNTAATLQVALQHQRKVLEGVEAVTATTNDLIAQTAEQLKTQGVQIQKRAAEAQLDIETLKRAFLDVESALEDLSAFRRNALPQMANSIVEMDQLSGEMEKSIQRMEKGDQVANDMILDIEIIDPNKG